MLADVECDDGMRVLQGNEELLERKSWDGVNSGRGVEERVLRPKL